MKLRFLFLMVAVAMANIGWACTNFMVTRGASVDGSTMITYSADSHTRYGQLRYHPATDHEEGEMLRIFDYGSLKFR